MSYKNIGSVGPATLKTEQDYEPGKGWKTIQRYRGTVTQLAAVVSDLQFAGCQFHLDPESEDHNYYTLTVTFGAGAYNGGNPPDPGEPLSDQWELDVNDLEKSLWEFPTIIAEFEKILSYAGAPDADPPIPSGANILKQIKKQIQDTVEGTSEDPDVLITVPVLPAPYTINVTLLLNFMGQLVRGVEAFTVSQLVLRRTMQIAPNCTIKASLANVGKIYAASAIATAYGIPNTIRFGLPTTGYWLKRSPTVSGPGKDGRWTIKQEFWWAETYSTFIYSAAS